MPAYHLRIKQSLRLQKICNRCIYFVAETKGTLDHQALRELEKMKINCGEKHFALFDPLGVKYQLAVTTRDLY
ncbi:MAG: hypothetical protein ACK5BG_05080 [Pseudanabaena sp.]